MTLYSNEERRIQGLSLDDIEAPLLDVLGSRFGRGILQSPLSSARRYSELREALYGREIDPSVTEFGEPLEFEGPDSPMVPMEEANLVGKPLGLEFDQDIPQRALDIYVERKREELARDALFARAPVGITAATLGFLSELLAAATDPINLASAFVPVVGPGRWASMVARMGVGGARATKGVLEGSVGAALVEPIVLGAATQEQSDYEFADSILNVAFGGILGGGLHYGLGRVSDALAGGRRAGAAGDVSTAADRGDLLGNAAAVDAASPATRYAAMRAVVGALERGLRPDVTPILNLDPGYVAAGATPTQLARQAGSVRRALQSVGRDVRSDTLRAGDTFFFSRTDQARNITDGTNAGPTEPYQVVSRRGRRLEARGLESGVTSTFELRERGRVRQVSAEEAPTVAASLGELSEIIRDAGGEPAPTSPRLPSQRTVTSSIEATRRVVNTRENARIADYDAARDADVRVASDEPSRELDEMLEADESLLEDVVRRISDRDPEILQALGLADETTTPSLIGDLSQTKVVDESGRPLILFHGTGATRIDEFDVSKINPNESVKETTFNGFWFASNGSTEEFLPPGVDQIHQVAVALDIRNPAPQNVWKQVGEEVAADGKLRKGARSSFDEVRFRLQDMGYDGVHHRHRPDVDRAEFERTGRASFDTPDGMVTIQRNPDFPDEIDVFDGEPLPENELTGFQDFDEFLEGYQRTEVWVAFEPKQIKILAQGDEEISKLLGVRYSSRDPVMAGVDFTVDRIVRGDAAGAKLTRLVDDDGQLVDIEKLDADIETARKMQEHLGSWALCVAGG